MQPSSLIMASVHGAITTASQATASQDLHFMELFRLHWVSSALNDGDTLVFVDYPSAAPGRPPFADCHGNVFGSQAFRVHSDKLRATGSARFLEMLEPSYQARVRRRRCPRRNGSSTIDIGGGSSGGGGGGAGTIPALDGLPDGVEYVLDLTPPSEGDELVFQVARMSLTPGIIRWRDRRSSLMTEPRPINGHDDVCSCGGRIGDDKNNDNDNDNDNDEDEDEDGDGDNEYGDEEGDAGAASPIGAGVTSRPCLRSRTGHGVEDEEKQPSAEGADDDPFLRMPDYCPVRHRNSIVRILMLVEGVDVVLDSASRMWSLVAAAAILDCASVVRDKVTQWIMYDGNTRFMEVLPEETMRIGFDLEIPAVAQCGFRVLVYELAMELAASTASASGPRDDEEVMQWNRNRNISTGTGSSGIFAPDNQTTVLGRRKGDLDDELRNIVQHAARALVERMTLLLSGLRDVTRFHKPLGREWAVVLEMERVLALEPENKDNDDDDTNNNNNNIDNSNNDNTHSNEDLMHAREALRAVIEYSKGCVLRAWDETRIDISEGHRRLPNSSSYSGTGVGVGVHDVAECNAVQKMLQPATYQEIQACWKNDTDGRANRSWHIGCLTASLERYVYRNQRAVAASSAWDVFFRDAARHRKTYAGLRHPLIVAERLDLEVRSVVDPILASVVVAGCEEDRGGRGDGDGDGDGGIFSGGDGGGESAAARGGIAKHLLLTLSGEETKFLPLWAGGCDDGTGGVFSAALPPAEMGPAGPGPAYHTGWTVAANTTSSSAWDSMTAPGASASESESVVDGMVGLEIRSVAAVGSVNAQDSVGRTRQTEEDVSMLEQWKSKSKSKSKSEADSGSESFLTEGSEYREAVSATPRSMPQGQGSLSDWDMDIGSYAYTSDDDGDGDGSDDNDDSASTVTVEADRSSVGDAETLGGDDAYSEDGSVVFVELR